jgi:hypothetical protein
LRVNSSAAPSSSRRRTGPFSDSLGLLFLAIFPAFTFRLKISYLPVSILSAGGSVKLNKFGDGVDEIRKITQAESSSRLAASGDLGPGNNGPSFSLDQHSIGFLDTIPVLFPI